MQRTRRVQDPALALARKFSDAFPSTNPVVLRANRSVRHEIDFAPGSKDCVTRQWPLPHDQAKAIDAFFEGRCLAGHVREHVATLESHFLCQKG